MRTRAAAVLQPSVDRPFPAHPGRVRTISAVVTATALIAAGLVFAPFAQAAPPLTVVAPTTELVAANRTTTLHGLAVSGNAQSTLQVTVSTSVGTLSMTTTTGLTLSYGNHWSGDPAITFTGSQADIDAALGSVALSPGDTVGSSAQVEITAMIADGDHVYLATNKHFYKYVAAAGINWSDADAAAKTATFDGQPGYLATIPNSTVNDFISSRIEGAENVWFAATAYDDNSTYPRTWRWAEGSGESPIAGQAVSYCDSSAANVTCSFSNNAGLFSSWAPGEPNNSSGVEFRAVTNWGGSVGQWNDLPDANSGVDGYVVEFGDQATGSTGFTGVASGRSTIAVADVPGAPTHVSARAGHGSAVVSFGTADAHNAPVSGYTVTSAPGDVRVQCTASPCTISGLTNGTSYSFTVSATNSIGTGPGSAASQAITPTAPVLPPTPPNPPTVHPVVHPQLRAARVSVRYQTIPTTCSLGGAHVRRCEVTAYVGSHNRQIVVGRGLAERSPGKRTSTLAVAVTFDRRGRQLVDRPGGVHLVLRARVRMSGSVRAYTASTTIRAVAPHVILHRIHFAFNSARINAHDVAYLTRVRSHLGPVMSISCTGHTDYAGENSHEKKLSQRRARNVCTVLDRGRNHLHTSSKGDGGAHPETRKGSARSRWANRYTRTVLTY